MGVLRRFQARPQEPEPTTPRKDALADLLARAGRGDQAAFAALYDELAGLVYGVILQVVRDPAQSEEVAQEVFVELWRFAPRFDPARGTVTAWAATIAHRRAVDRVRSEDSARRRLERDATERDRAHAAVRDEVGEPVTDAAAREFDRKRVRKALERLTEIQREAVELAYFGGYTYREVAVLLDQPEGTIKTRIRDAMIRLRDELGAPQ